MNSFPQPSTPSSAYTAVYDAWNRMVSISDTGGTVATYQYDGRNRRTVKVTTATSETRHFYWTSNWQDIEERVGTATTMDKQYAWGIRYVDELVCRDDTTERIYACQDANFNLTAACNTSGSVVERYLFDPYGNRTIMNASWSVLSDSAYDWVIGFQGLMHDVESGLVYDRGRMFHLVLGSFTQRDPAEYMDGMNLYQDLRSNPVKFQDPYGLCTCNCPAYPVLQSGATPINPDSAHDLAQKWSSYLLDHAKDIPGMAGLGWFASLVDKANEGFDKSAGLQVWDYFAVVPCDANGNPGKTPLFWNTLADVNTLSSVGAYDRTLYYVPGYGNTTVAQWQKSLDSIYAEFDTEFNNWLDGQFPKCASIKSYHL
jgi:RHS repeat-associated protein